MEPEQNYKPATQAVHVGTRADIETGGVNTPISVSTSTKFMERADIVYPRMGNTPNHKAVIEKLCALEGAEDGLLFGSGMGAVSALFLGVLEPGDHVVVQENIYGGSHFFLVSELHRFGVKVSFVNSFAIADFEKEIQASTKLIYVETPSNPLLHILDLKDLASMAKRKGVLTAIDNTFASPIVQRPMDSASIWWFTVVQNTWLGIAM